MEITQIIEGIEIADVILTTVVGSAAISEALPFVKKVKANSSFQLCFNILKTLLRLVKPKKSPIPKS